MSAIKAKPFIIDLEAELPANIQAFLNADILIVNIPSKNIDAFAELIQAIEQSPVKKVLFVSSTSVYKNNNKTITESDGEESSQSPLLMIESLFRNSRQFKTTVVRFGGLIGYSRHPGRFFGNGRVVSDPDTGVNLIHRDDCIGIIGQIIAQDTWGDLFNGCADTHPSKRAFYTQAALAAGQPVPVFVDAQNQPFKIVSNEKVKRVLNYKFLHPDVMKIPFE
nr:dTDP-glucose 4,6-dehydratase [uncultured bacterium]